MQLLVYLRNSIRKPIPTCALNYALNRMLTPIRWLSAGESCALSSTQRARDAFGVSLCARDPATTALESILPFMVEFSSSLVY